MDLEGTVRNGLIVPDIATALPEGSRVRIEPVPAEKSKTFFERYGDLISNLPELPDDLAAQHDHYRLGTPKR